MDIYGPFEVRWADLDPNFHLRHSAYADYAAHVRFSWLDKKGFSLDKFRELGMGPVIFTEKIDYLREVRAGESITINVQLSTMSADGRKFTITHEIFKRDQVKSAEIKITGAWFSTLTRKIVVPPPELLGLLRDLPKAGDFH
jgi:acyl-CoA thioester hydrolase